MLGINDVNMADTVDDKDVAKTASGVGAGDESRDPELVVPEAAEAPPGDEDVPPAFEESPEMLVERPVERPVEGSAEKVVGKLAADDLKPAAVEAVERTKDSQCKCTFISILYQSSRLLLELR